MRACVACIHTWECFEFEGLIWFDYCYSFYRNIYFLIVLLLFVPIVCMYIFSTPLLPQHPSIHPSILHCSSWILFCSERTVCLDCDTWWGRIKINKMRELLTHGWSRSQWCPSWPRPCLSGPSPRTRGPGPGWPRWQRSGSCWMDGCMYVGEEGNNEATADRQK